MCKPTGRLSELQSKVIDQANAICSKESWYSGGVCTDHFPSDEEIERDFEQAVERVVCETAYWDGTGNL